MGRITVRRRARRVSVVTERPTVARIETLAVEEPLEIRIGGASLAVTMRTPGHDWDLVSGFLATEGVVRGPADIVSMRYCSPTSCGEYAPDDTAFNVVDVELAPGVTVPASASDRNLLMSSACGVCGKASIDSISVSVPPGLRDDRSTVPAEVLAGLPDTMRAEQKVFDRTGGLHAAGLFDLQGTLLCVREDVGRHNAVDKVLGWALREGLADLGGHVLQVSGRLSFELTQKAGVRGVPIVSAVSAPSSLAVDLAEEIGVTLVGFVRHGSMNVYTHGHRVLEPSLRLVDLSGSRT